MTKFPDSDGPVEGLGLEPGELLGLGLGEALGELLGLGLGDTLWDGDEDAVF